MTSLIVRHPQLRVLALVSFLGAVAACSAASSAGSDAATNASPDGGSGGTRGEGDAASGPAKPHPLCSNAAPTFPDDFGGQCGMASNLELCVSTNSATCSNKLCLWDNQASDAYCTVACEPGNAAACPSGYECKPQGCDGPKNVCIRAEKATAPVCEKPGDDLGGRNVQIYGVVRVANGRLYARGIASSPTAAVIVSRGPNETKWTKIFEDAALTNVTSIKLAAGKDAAAIPLTNEKVAIVKGTDVKVASLPECSGGASDCLAYFNAFFATTDGGLRAFATDGDGALHLVSELTPAVGGSTPVDLKGIDFVGVADGGLVGSCAPKTGPATNLCTSSNGETFAPVALPSGETLASLVASGTSIDDFFFVGGSGKVWHRTGGSWLEEGISSAPAQNGQLYGAAISRAADGTIFVSVAGDTAGEPKLFALTGGCWASVEKTSSVFGVPVDGTTFLVSYQGGKLCSETVKL